MDIAEIIKEIRAEKGLTQKGLAEEFNVSESTVQKWETGKNVPTLDMIALILSFAGKKLAVISDNDCEADIADASATDVPVKPAGKITRYKDMGMPDWVEDRFGSDVPDWAEERWGSSDDDWDDDDYEATASDEQTESKPNAVDPRIMAQVNEFFFDEIKKDGMYKGIVVNVQAGFGKMLAFVDVDGLVVACEIPTGVAKAIRCGDTCFVKITRKEKASKRIFGTIVSIKPIFRGTINFVSEFCKVAIVNLGVNGGVQIPLAALSEAEGLSNEECKTYLPGKEIEFEVLSCKDINDKRVTQTGENKQLYRSERKRYWYDGDIKVGDEVSAKIFHVSKQEIEIWLHGVKIIIPAENISEKYCRTLKDILLEGDVCRVMLNSITFSDNPEADDYSVSVDAELHGVMRVVDPHGELCAATYKAAKEKGYKIHIISPSKDECEPPR